MNMGLRLGYWLVDDSPEHIEEVNEWLETLPQNQKLGSCRIRFITEEATERESLIGGGEIKITGLSERGDSHQFDSPAEVKEAWAEVFEKLHERTEVEFPIPETPHGVRGAREYFTSEQIDRLTGDI